MAFEVNDSGDRLEFDSGMVREPTTGKPDYLLLRDGPMYKRWAAHVTKGASKYLPRNWMRANSFEELDRFRESACRHFEQWLKGDTDEDHAAAVFFNINGAEYVRDQLKKQKWDMENPVIKAPPGTVIEYDPLCPPGKVYSLSAEYAAYVKEAEKCCGKGSIFTTRCKDCPK